MKLSEQQADFLDMVSRMIYHMKPYIENINGIVKVTSWLRTMQQQRKLYMAGFSKTLNSKHLKGLAVDLAIIIDGKMSNSSNDYRILGSYWESHGGVWGGSWKTFKDIYHFEYNKERRRQWRESLNG